MASQEVDVYLASSTGDALVGRAWFSQRRGGPVTTVFAYANTYLSTPGVQSIDPNIQLTTGNQYIDGLPGAFQDAAPDRWGRTLIDKRSRLTAPPSQRRQLNDVDYLLGVSDATRQGAIRFRRPDGNEFLDPSTDVPKLIELPHLLRAAESLDSADDYAAVKALLDAGSGSLGGARPKASVRAANGDLLIAKFPHRSDEWDVMAWECVALDIAERAGISAPGRELVDVVDGKRALVLNRFDRTPKGDRVGYLSAMSMLAASDGEWHDYTEIADSISDYGSNTAQDLANLYRRASLSIGLRNTDDHLRNHGFLASAGGWELSPVFDINPNPDLASPRVTGISGATHQSEEPAGLAELAQVCRLTEAAARQIRSEVSEALSRWRTHAQRRGITHEEQDRLADVFDTANDRLH